MLKKDEKKAFSAITYIFNDCIVDTVGMHLFRLH